MNSYNSVFPVTLVLFDEVKQFISPQCIYVLNYLSL